MGPEDQQGTSHYSKEDGDVSQSEFGVEGKARKRASLDVSCMPANVIAVAALLSDEEKEKVTLDGFGTFLELKLSSTVRPKASEWLYTNSELKKDHIAMHVAPGLTENFSPDVVHKILKVPRGTVSKVPHFNYKEEFNRLRNQLGLPKKTSLHIEMLKDKLPTIGDSTLRLRIFYLTLISSFLLPSSKGQVNKEAVMYSMDITKIAEFDWCTLIYEHLRKVIKKHNPSRRSLHGCSIVLLIYFLDNIQTGTSDMDEDKDKIGTSDMGEDKDEPARLNLYSTDMVQKMIGKARVRRNGNVAFDNFQLKARGQTCYGESSITQLSSVESQVEGMDAAGPSNVQYLKKLLLQVKPFAPDSLKEEISEATRGPVASSAATSASIKDLYNQYVLSKIGSADKTKRVLSINNWTMSEHRFVESFKPEGLMDSFALHAQCSIWNAQCHDRIYLPQDCIDELKHGISYKSLSHHLTEEKINCIKLIFVPVFSGGHCFLVVANLDKNSFDYLDSLKSGHYYECACTIYENLKKYLCNHGINAMTWSLTALPVRKQNNTYDCGFRTMLHMIYYGQEKVLHILEDMVYRYRMEFAVQLLHDPANKAHPSPTTSRGSANSDTTRSPYQNSLNDNTSSYIFAQSTSHKENSGKKVDPTSEAIPCGKGRAGKGRPRKNVEVADVKMGSLKKKASLKKKRRAVPDDNEGKGRAGKQQPEEEKRGEKVSPDDMLLNDFRNAKKMRLDVEKAAPKNQSEKPEQPPEAEGQVVKEPKRKKKAVKKAAPNMQSEKPKQPPEVERQQVGRSLRNQDRKDYKAIAEGAGFYPGRM